MSVNYKKQAFPVQRLPQVGNLPEPIVLNLNCNGIITVR
jgi:hypothetical protein